jgi:L-fuconolactonase
VDALAPRIDAHHHLWDLSAHDQPWITEAMAPIRRSFGVHDLIAVSGPAGITATVLVQALPAIVETEELLDVAALTPLIAGVVGWVDLAADGVDDQLDRLLGRPSGMWLVGIRAMAQSEPDQHWLLRPAVLDGFRSAATRGLAVDLLARADQLSAATGAVSAVPEGRFVLDHLAKPAISARAWEPWARELTALALCTNVSAKLSGLVTEANWSSWTVDELRPYVEHAMAAFGAERLLFGSDWPVCTLAASYTEVVRAAEDLVGGLDANSRAAVFGANAAALYDLRDRAASA